MAVGPRRPNVHGVQQLVDVAQLSAEEVFDAVAAGRWVGEVVEVSRLGLGDVEARFDIGGVDVDGGDSGFGVVDALVGCLGMSSGGVAGPEAGMEGVVVGRPQGWP